MSTGQNEHLSNETDVDVDAILTACDKGDVRFLAEFIISGGELSDVTDLNGRNALHHCVCCSNGARQPELETANLLGQFDRIKCARIIMKSSPELMESLDSDGWSPLHLAVVHSDLDFLRAMLEFEPYLAVRTYVPNTMLNGRQVFGRTSIHFAVLHQKLEALHVLVQAFVKPWINVLDDQGATALHYAVQLPSPKEAEAIQLLVNTGQADINELDAHGRTALSWAATIGAPRAIAVLLQLGAKLNIKDECGLTALHCAASRGNTEVVQCLLNWITTANMDDPSQIAIFRDVSDKDGCSPLFYSVTLGHTGVTNVLLEAGANVHTVDRKGRTLAHCLARSQISQSETEGNHIISQLSQLVQAGLSLWKSNQAGATPLHEACLLRNVMVVFELAKYAGFDDAVHARDAQGHTPLHLVVAASWSGDKPGLEICKCLLEHRADVNAKTELPQGGPVTALDLAIMNETEEGVTYGQMHQLLVSFGAKKVVDLINTDEDALPTVEQDTEKANSHPSETHSSHQLSNKHDGATTASCTVPVQTNNRTSKKHSSTSSTTLDAMPKKQRKKLHNKPSQLSDKQSPVQGRKVPQAEGKMLISPVATTSETPQDGGRIPLAELHTKNTVLSMESKGPRKKVRKRSKPLCPQVENTPEQISEKTHNVSTASTTSSSVRVNTPTSSDMDTVYQKSVQHQGRANAVSREQRQQGSSHSVDHDEHYSRSNLDRILPIMLDRYMHRQDWECSPLTGRYRMPKPTLSPYLVPLLPSMKGCGSLRHPVVQSADHVSSRRAGSIPPPKHLRKSNSGYASDQSRVPRPQCSTSQRTSTRGSLESRDKKQPGQTPKKSEYYKLLEDLARLELQRGQTRKITPIKPNRSVREPRRPDNVEPSKYRSAMGGELSPIGRREVSTSPDEREREKGSPGHRRGRKSRPTRAKNH